MPHPDRRDVPAGHAAEGDAPLVAVGAGLARDGLPADFGVGSRAAAYNALHHIHHEPRGRGAEHLPPLLLGLGVLFWIAGFDALYSCQDKNFDESQGLHSLPVRFGLHGAMLLAAFCHVNTVMFLLLTGLACALSWGWYAAILVAGGILLWEHRLLSPDNLHNIRFAFALNGPISILLLIGTLLGVFL